MELDGCQATYAAFLALRVNKTVVDITQIERVGLGVAVTQGLVGKQFHEALLAGFPPCREKPMTKVR